MRPRRRLLHQLEPPLPLQPQLDSRLELHQLPLPMHLQLLHRLVHPLRLPLRLRPHLAPLAGPPLPLAAPPPPVVLAEQV